MTPETVNREDLLFQYVSKSQLMAKLLEINPHDEKIAKLKTAIKYGDFSAKELQEEDADLYLLYLIKHKLIKYEDGITAYLYLMSKIQFPHQDQIKIYLLVEQDVESGEKKLTEIGEAYLAYLVFWGKSIQVDFSFAHLKDLLFSLNPSEQKLIGFPNLAMIETGDYANIVDEINISVGLLAANVHLDTQSKTGLGTCVLPSLSMIDYLLSKIPTQGTPLQICPVFGRVSDKTLYALSKVNLRIGALFSKFVKSNLINVHHVDVGPLTAFQHDIYHLISGNFVNEEERKSLANELTDMLILFADHLKSLGEADLSRSVQDLTITLGENDFMLVMLIRLKNDYFKFLTKIENDSDPIELNSENVSRLYLKMIADLFLDKKGYIEDESATPLSAEQMEKLFHLLTEFKLPESISDKQYITRWEYFLENLRASLEDRQYLDRDVEAPVRKNLHFDNDARYKNSIFSKKDDRQSNDQSNRPMSQSKSKRT